MHGSEGKFRKIKEKIIVARKIWMNSYQIWEPGITYYPLYIFHTGTYFLQSRDLSRQLEFLSSKRKMGRRDDTQPTQRKVFLGAPHQTLQESVLNVKKSIAEH